MVHKLSAQPLLSAAQIDVAVRQLALRIHADYGEEPVLVVGLMNGVFLFLADLVRQIPRPLELAFLRASSYQSSTQSSGQVLFDGSVLPELSGRKVLLVDDILDTGNTLFRVREHLLQCGAQEVRLCVLLDKPSRRQKPVEADYCGFTIDDHFVVGYGLDFDGQYRNLPAIWLVEELNY